MGIDIRRTPEMVTVALSGIDLVFALKSRLEIPRDRIESVSVQARRDVGILGGSSVLRLPGTHVPGLVRHGSYGVRPNREFWAAFGRKDVLVIDVRDWDFARIVLGVPAPRTVAASLGT